MSRSTFREERADRIWMQLDGALDTQERTKIVFIVTDTPKNGESCTKRPAHHVVRSAPSVQPPRSLLSRAVLETTTLGSSATPRVSGRRIAWLMNT
jgi:hypothetical protein